MKIHRSNRTENLVEALAQLLENEPLDPMRKEVVAVQGRGIERWLSMKLAMRQGVVANIEFPFPRAVVDAILAATLGEEMAGGAGQYRPDSLAFHVLELLPELLDHEAFAEIAAYLEPTKLDEKHPVSARAHALAERIAGVFDRYLTYRPELVLGWLAHRDESDWQRVLFCKLRERIARPSFPELAERCVEKLVQGAFERESLWPRLSLFGLSTLPPLYVRILEAASRHLPVHLFLLSPSEHFFGDMLNRREERRMLSRAGKSASEEQLAIVRLNALLHSFGQVGRDFQNVIEEHATDEGQDSLFEDPGRATLLHALQSDMLTLSDPEPLSEEKPSIEVHSCHGTTRQVEVLRDVLVRLFDEIPDLEPRDVVVMAPDIDELAPVIDAVFSEGDEGKKRHAGFPRLPYRIADRPSSHDNPVAEATLALLELSKSRMRAPEVLAFFAREPVSRKFGFDIEALSTLRAWLDETAVRWGADAEDRKAHGFPGFEEQTFRDGLDRMLLGHAMRGDGTRLFEGKLGYDEANDSRLLGSLISAVDVLFRVVATLRRPNTVEAFCQDVDDAMEALFEIPAGLRWQGQAVRNALADLAHGQRGLERTLSFEPEALHRMVNVPLRSASSESFASGAITFCAMVPMRSVPFRVVCLLGMDDGAFPRRSKPDGFDRAASDPRPGDRILENDDRYLVLEALLSARDRFVVLYSGRSTSDNRKLPPAVPVSELLDAMAALVPIEGEASDSKRREEVEKRYVVEHPLQPFGPASFASKEPNEKGAIPTRSYDVRRLAAARALAGKGSEPRRFFTERLDMPKDAALRIDDLARFFADPAKAFFEKRLGVRFQEEGGELDDRERIESDHLERYKAHDAVLDLMQRGIEPSAIEPILKARSLLPIGIAGRASARETIADVASWQGMLDRLREGGKREGLGIDAKIRGVQLIGRLRDIHAQGRLRVTWARGKASRRVEEWVRHIVYCAFTDESEPRSVLVERGKDDVAAATIWGPDPSAREKLEELVELWKEGQQAPLLFFAQPASDYANALRKNEKLDPDERLQLAVDAAHKAWSSSFVGTAPCDEPHNARLFSGIGRELFTSEFVWPGKPRFPELVRAIWMEVAKGSEQ